MKKFFLFTITIWQINKEVSNDDLESPPTPPAELEEKNNSKLETPPSIPELK